MDQKKLPRTIKGATEILRETSTPQCSIYIECDGEYFEHTLKQAPSNDKQPSPVYCIGSLTKIFIAYCLIILIQDAANEGNPSDDEFVEREEKLWDLSIEEHLGIELPGTPSIEDVVSHLKELPSLNDFMFGPDGKVLIRKEQFPEIASHLAAAIEPGKDMPAWSYGNGGYVIAGLFIEKFAKCSVEEYLQKNVFEPFEMENTYTSPLGLNEEKLAKPHSISSNGDITPIVPVSHSDTIAFPATGIYSCPQDLARFFKEIFSIASGRLDTTVHQERRVNRLLFGLVGLNDWRETEFSYCGLKTNMSTTVPGILSMNRTVSDKSDSSAFEMGRDKAGKVLEVIYRGGLVTGYTSCIYLMPKHREFIIALSNATGDVDVADYIARYLIQELYGLRETSSLIPSQRDFDQRKALFIEKVRQNRGEYSTHFRKLHSGLLRGDPIQDRPELAGRYINEEFGQYVLIESGSDSSLSIRIGGDRDFNMEYFSREFRLTLVANDIVRICIPPGADEDCFCIDIRQDWCDLTLQILQHEDGSLRGLERKSRGFSVRYDRITE